MAGVPLVLLVREFTRPPVSETVPTVPKSNPAASAEKKAPSSPSDSQTQVGGSAPQWMEYRGWTNAVHWTNAQVEVIVVPAIGRILQFRFHGDSGPFWEHPELGGHSPDAQSSEWINFGGDKAWPSPQSEWPLWTPRAWPPPPAFDSMAVQATLEKDHVLLTSPVDPYYGIRTLREIWLDALQPKLRVVTTFERVTSGTSPNSPQPHPVGIWIVTQLQHPESVFVPLPTPTRFPGGYDLQSDTPPSELLLQGDLLSLKRDSKASHKIGTDSDRLLWVGSSCSLLIQSARTPQGVYPDHSSSAEVYTNPDPLPYVELEMLASLQSLEVGARMSQTNHYTLHRRQAATPLEEARRVLGL